MFGKLLKNDLKAQWHSVSAIYLVAIIVAAVAEGFALFSDGRIAVALSSTLVVLILMFTSLITLIAVAIMFSNTLFGRAGYLTLTLPVKTGSLIRSKTLSGLIWIFVSYGLLIGSVFLSFSQLKEVLGDELTTSTEDILAIFGIPSFFTIFIGVIVLCVSFTAVILVLVQSLYLAIALSNVSPLSKFGKFGAVIMFFVIFGVVQSVTTKIGGMWSMGVVISEASLTFTSNTASYAGAGNMCVGLFGTVLRMVAAVALHYPITAIIKNKVNVR